MSGVKKRIDLRDAEELTYASIPQYPELDKVVETIKRMERPEIWDNDKFKYARRGAYLTFWRVVGQKDNPPGCEPAQSWKDKQFNYFIEYLFETAKGKNWNKGCLAPWIKAKL